MPKNKGDGKIKTENPKPQEKEEKGTGKGLLFSILTFLTVLIIIAAVFGGVFYFIIHNNFGGMTDKYRSTIQDIPVLKMALPKVKDPLNPKNMTAREIKKKYVEFRDENEVLKKQLADANDKLTVLQNVKGENTGLKQKMAKLEQDIAKREAAIQSEKLQMNTLKKKIDALIATGNKDGFAKYYASVNADTAKQIYTQIVKEQQKDANTKKFAQVYAAMDASAAAQIFEQLGTSKLDMTAKTLKAMNKGNSSAILAAMTPSFAAKVTEKLDALYKAD